MAELVSILKALADETRFKLVNLLLKQDYCVGGLAIRLNISESAISQHRKVLRDAGSAVIVPADFLFCVNSAFSIAICKDI